MRRGIALLLGLAALALLIAAVAVHPDPLILSADRSWQVVVEPSQGPLAPPKVTAQSAFLADADTGKELFSVNPDEERPNASTTKILTATLAIQSGNLGRTIKVSKHAADAEPANIEMKEGEKFTLKNLLWAMMLHSANDCAIAIAEGVGGTERHFVDKMNEKARSLGCMHTHFVTPNGLHDPDHYTTARDLAAITVYALKLPFFNELIKAKSHKIERSLNKKNVVMHRSRSDKFLDSYDGADGVKTGFTHPAGRCYVGSASHPDEIGRWRLVTVVLRALDTIGDTSAMMDYGFKAWGRKELVHPGQIEGSMKVVEHSGGANSKPAEDGDAAGKAPMVSFSATDGVTTLLKKETQHTIDYRYHVLLQAPANKGDRVGQLEVSVDGVKQDPIPLALNQPVPIPVRFKEAQGARLLFGSLALLTLGCSYGALTKTNRRRRTKLPSDRRGLDTERTRVSERPGRDDW